MAVNLTTSVLNTAEDLQLIWISKSLPLGAIYIDVTGIDDAYNTSSQGGNSLLGMTTKGVRIIKAEPLVHGLRLTVQRQAPLFDAVKGILLENDQNPSSIDFTGQFWAWSPSSGMVDHFLGVCCLNIEDGYGLNSGKTIKEASINFSAELYRKADYMAVKAIANIVQGLFNSPVANKLREVALEQEKAKEKSRKDALRKAQAELEEKCRHNPDLLKELSNELSKSNVETEEDAKAITEQYEEVLDAQLN